MASRLDMSLDDIAKQNRASRGAGRGGAKSAAGPMRKEKGAQQQQQQQQQPRRGGAPQHQRTPYQRPPQQLQSAAPLAALQYAAPVGLAYAPSNALQYAAPAPQQVAAQQPAQQPQPVKKIQGDTIHVSNLSGDVTEEDIKEIFERIGPVKSVQLAYDRTGRSSGTATVTFVRRPDAEKALQEFDEAEVEGRVMRIKLIGSVVTTPVVVKKAQQQATAVAPAAPADAAPVVQHLLIQHPAAVPHYAQAPRPHVQQQQQRQSKSVVSRPSPAQHQQQPRSARAPRPAPAGNGAQRGGRVGAAPAPRKPQAPKAASQEDLDAELDSYHSRAAKASVDPASAGQPTSV